jgi:hypothetical protein
MRLRVSAFARAGRRAASEPARIPRGDRPTGPPDEAPT